MIWSVLGRALYWTIGGIQAVGEAVVSGRRLIRQMRQGVVPMVDESEPMPLSRPDVEWQRAQMRRATRPPGTGPRTR